MAQMSMNRVIHGAVRRDLARFESALRDLTAGDTRRAADLLRAWENFAVQLHHHHAEHDLVWPALRSVGVDLTVLEEMDGEHEAMADALDAAGATLSGLSRSPDEHHRSSALAAVRHLREVTEAHLGHEEAALEPVFDEKRHTPELAAMEKRLRGGGPGQTGMMMAWVSDGLGAQERRAFREHVPPPVVAVLVRVFGRRYTRQIAPVWR